MDRLEKATAYSTNLMSIEEAKMILMKDVNGNDENDFLNKIKFYSHIILSKNGGVFNFDTKNTVIFIYRSQATSNSAARVTYFYKLKKKFQKILKFIFINFLFF